MCRPHKPTTLVVFKVDNDDVILYLSPSNLQANYMFWGWKVDDKIDLLIYIYFSNYNYTAKLINSSSSSFISASMIQLNMHHHIYLKRPNPFHKMIFLKKIMNYL